MSDASVWRKGVNIVACALALAPMAPLEAQRATTRSVEERFVESRHRLDSLSAAFEAAKAAIDDAVPPLSMVDGLVHVLYDTSVTARTLATIHEAARLATEHITRLQGDAAERTIGRVEFIAREPVSGYDKKRYLDLRLRGGAFPFNARFPRTTDVARVFEAVAAEQATNQLRTGLGDQRLGRVPARLLDADGWTDLAIWTATSSSSVARRCIDGRLADCRRLLLIAPTAARLEDWYEPADYPALVERSQWYSLDTRMHDLKRRCIEERQFDACSEAAHNMSVPYPIPVGAAHDAVVGIALERGGPHALTRMFAAPSDDLARVEAAAGVPIDSVVADWQRHIVDAKPRHGVSGLIFVALWFSTLAYAVSIRRPTCA